MAHKLKRPTEIATAATGVVGAGLTGALSPNRWLALIPLVVGWASPCFTFLVDNGGLSGVFRSLWKGKGNA